MQVRRLLSWLGPFRQTTTYLGVVMIIVIWAGAFFLASEKQDNALDYAQRQGSNLVRIFAEYISRVINGTDSQLLMLRDLYQNNPSTSELTHWINNAQFKNDLTVQFAVADADGNVLYSSADSSSALVNIADRDHFRFHIDAVKDELYISAPVLGRNSGKWTINLTRRLLSQNGEFNGIIIAALDISKLEGFYNSIDVDASGIISLVGLDGIIRVRSGREPNARRFVGESVANTPLFKMYQHARSGHYWNLGAASTQFNGVRRMISYRVVEGLPLIAVVGLAKDDIFRKADAETTQYYKITAIVTAFVLVVMGFGAVRQMTLLSTTAETARAHQSLERSNESLELTNRRFDTALENMTHGICMFDASKRLVVCNRQYANLYRLPPELQQVGTTHEAIIAHRVLNGLLVGGSNASAVEKKLESLDRLPLNEPSVRIDELADGRLIRVIRQPMDGGGWVATHEDITAQKRSEMQIIHMARHDILTGLSNRAVLLEKVKEALARNRRTGEVFTIFMLDLDRFKGVNDTLGHHVGDELLKEAAQRLRAALRETDTLARLGGDEFAIIQSGEPEQREAAIALAIRIIESLNDPFEIEGNKLNIGTSIGIAAAPEDGTDCDELLKKADMALYRAKADGRNGYAFFDPAMTAEATARHHMEKDLRRAIANRELELHYQPVIDIKSRRACGVEALVRWRHPEKGLISPAEFIPLAEETGLIVPLGEWVLQQACMDAAKWPAHVKVAVNISSVQFKKGNLLDVILCILVDSGLAPQRLELEITESVLFENEGTNVAMMHQLKNLGISIALDDFGTGYSSLSYLTMFPFDKIKIDKSFTMNMTRNPASAAIIAAVLSLGRSLGVATTAEGVETRQEFRALSASGVNYIQGYFFSRPCPAAELDFAKTYDWDAVDLGAKGKGKIADVA